MGRHCRNRKFAHQWTMRQVARVADASLGVIAVASVSLGLLLVVLLMLMM